MYKVVTIRQNREYVSACENFYFKDHLTYKLNEITKPKIGKIFVFGKIKDAKKFIYSTGFCLPKAILECEVGNPQPCMQIAIIEYIDEFWKGLEDGEDVVDMFAPSPEGTIICDWVKPLSVVKY